MESPAPPTDTPGSDLIYVVSAVHMLDPDGRLILSTSSIRAEAEEDAALYRETQQMGGEKIDADSLRIDETTHARLNSELMTFQDPAQVPPDWRPGPMDISWRPTA